MAAAVARTEGTADVVKPVPLPKLPPDVLRILRGHRPGIPAYLSWALGPISAAADLVPIDRAYADLLARGLVTAGDKTLSVLPGEVRTPFVLTAEGDRVRRMWPTVRA
jgi:hypothetical protein